MITRSTVASARGVTATEDVSSIHASLAPRSSNRPRRTTSTGLQPFGRTGVPVIAKRYCSLRWLAPDESAVKIGDCEVYNRLSPVSMPVWCGRGLLAIPDYLGLIVFFVGLHPLRFPRLPVSSFRSLL